MCKYEWIEQIDFQKFSTPFTVKRDNEYFPKLKEMLFNLVSEIESNGAEKQIVDATRDYVEKITRSIELYYMLSKKKYIICQRKRQINMLLIY